MIRPEEAMSAALRAAQRGLAQVPESSAEEFIGFLIQSGEKLDLAAQAFARVADQRPLVSDDVLRVLQGDAYLELFLATASSLMTLAMFPYLRHQPHANPAGPEGERL